MSVSNTIRIPVERKDNGAALSCEASHPALVGQKRVRHYSLDVHCEPTMPSRFHGYRRIRLINVVISSQKPHLFKRALGKPLTSFVCLCYILPAIIKDQKTILFHYISHQKHLKYDTAERFQPIKISNINFTQGLLL